MLTAQVGSQAAMPVKGSEEASLQESGDPEKLFGNCRCWHDCCSVLHRQSEHGQSAVESSLQVYICMLLATHSLLH